MPRRAAVLVLSTMLLCSREAHAQIAHPMITHLRPVALERGATAKILISGQQDFAGANAVLVDDPSVTGKVVAEGDANSSKAMAAAKARRINVSALLTASVEAPFGPREVRVVTPAGVSTVGPLLIVDRPVRLENKAHGDLASALPLEPETVVAGSIAANEELDVYKVAADKGKTYTFEVTAARLMHKVHDLQNHFDPLLSLADTNGRELATSDDAYFADPLLIWTCPESGDYYLTLRDVRYAGDPRWSYALRCSIGPHVTSVFPTSLSTREQRSIDVFGVNLPRSTVSQKAPAGAGLNVALLPIAFEQQMSNPVPFAVSDGPFLLESSIAPSTPIPYPVTIAGRLDQPGQIDRYTLDLPQGAAIKLEINSRRLGAPLDAVLKVIGPNQSLLASGDDFERSKDAQVRLTTQKKGAHIIEVKDLLKRGGPTFNYLLEVSADEPDFEITCDGDKASPTKGNRVPWYLKVTRTGGFQGPVDIDVQRLPTGIRATPLTIASNMTQGVLLLEATKDAAGPPCLASVVGRARVKDGRGERDILRNARYQSEIYLPGGGRGLYEINRPAVSVANEGDLLSVHAHPERITLKPGGTAAIDVEIKRSDRYKGPVTLDMLLRHLNRPFGDPFPAGIRLVERGSKTRLGPNETKGRLIIEAEATAKPIDNVPLAAVAWVSINFVVKRPYSSQILRLDVRDESKSVARGR